jgi:hypothetical protein
MKEAGGQMTYGSEITILSVALPGFEGQMNNVSSEATSTKTVHKIEGDTGITERAGLFDQYQRRSSTLRG